METKKLVTYKVERNEKYGDFRVAEYRNGVWTNERDNNWSKAKAEKVATEYRNSRHIMA